MIAALDALRGHWGQLVRRQQLTQILVALVLSLQSALMSPTHLKRCFARWQNASN